MLFCYLSYFPPPPRPPFPIPPPLFLCFILSFLPSTACPSLPLHSYWFSCFFFFKPFPHNISISFSVRWNIAFVEIAQNMFETIFFVNVMVVFVHSANGTVKAAGWKWKIGRFYLLLCEWLYPVPVLQLYVVTKWGHHILSVVSHCICLTTVIVRTSHSVSCSNTWLTVSSVRTSHSVSCVPLHLPNDCNCDNITFCQLCVSTCLMTKLWGCHILSVVCQYLFND